MTTWRDEADMMILQAFADLERAYEIYMTRTSTPAQHKRDARVREELNNLFGQTYEVEKAMGVTRNEGTDR